MNTEPKREPKTTSKQPSKKRLLQTVDAQQLRLVLAILLICAGMTLLFMGFWISPRGEIHSSVLIAYGEVMTFVGALIGIDYAARERWG